MRHLIVAHHHEYLLWLAKVAVLDRPYAIHVVSNGLHRPNTGREAGAYLWWILDNYDRLVDDDVYAFVQGDPFAHCFELCKALEQDVDGFTPLADFIADSDATGLPHHAGLPIAAWYEHLTGETFPTGGITFGAGAQWMAPGRVLSRRPRDFYEALVELADWQSGDMCGGPWVLERLWEAILR